MTFYGLVLLELQPLDVSLQNGTCSDLNSAHGWHRRISSNGSKALEMRVSREMLTIFFRNFFCIKVMAVWKQCKPPAEKRKQYFDYGKLLKWFCWFLIIAQSSTYNKGNGGHLEKNKFGMFLGKSKRIPQSIRLSQCFSKQKLWSVKMPLVLYEQNFALRLILWDIFRQLLSKNWVFWQKLTLLPKLWLSQTFLISRMVQRTKLTFVKP